MYFQLRLLQLRKPLILSVLFFSYFLQTLGFAEQTSPVGFFQILSSPEEIKQIKAIELEIMQKGFDSINMRSLVERLPKKELHGRILVGLDLDMLLLYFLKVNKGIKEKDSDIKSALFALDQNRAKFNPMLSVGTSYSGNSSLSAFTGSDTTYMTINRRQNQNAYTAIGMTDTNGISYNLKYTLSHISPSTKNYSSELEEINSSEGESYYAGTLDFGMDIPLQKGFGESTLASVKKAGLGVKTAAIQKKEALEDLAKRVIALYWSFSNSFQRKESLYTDLELAKAVADESRVRYEIGVADRMTSQEAENRYLIKAQEIQEAELAIINIENIIKDAIGLLDLPYGIYPVYELNITDLTQGGILDVGAGVKKAEENSSAYELLKLQIESAQLEESVKVNATKNDINLGLGYTWNGFSDQAAGTSAQISSQKFTSYRIGLDWSIPLGTTADEALLSQARELVYKLKLREDSLKSDIALDIRDRTSRLELLMKSLEISESSISLYRDLFVREQEKFRLGTSTVLHLSEAQQSYFNATIAYINKYTDLRSAYDQLKVILGEHDLLQIFSKIK